MAVNLKSPEAEALLKRLAEQTGESLTEAATVAFRERLERHEKARAQVRKRAVGALSDLSDLIREAREARVPDERPLKQIADELWGNE
ncbi:MAG: type II toxin-antitoxin system VapB family antitoxin [Myxococcales bacterium]|nr:type II toxin-antitoxin system VapB family antitoxin [Myxococcales bacterium]